MKKEYSKYTDLELAKYLNDKKHSEGAFRELYRRHSSAVHSYCYSILRDDNATEDIFQETFMRFYETVNVEHYNLNIPGYLIKIARNLCLNYKRNKKSNVNIDYIDSYVSYSQNYENKQLLDILNSAIDLLEEEFKEAFVLREYTGLSYKDIADATMTTEENARSRVFRAKNKIKKILHPYLREIEKL
jgi:RNA polymerase sigma-70 factor, ECF subfamily